MPRLADRLALEREFFASLNIPEFDMPEQTPKVIAPASPSSPHPTPAEWLAKAFRRLNEPGGFVYQQDLVLMADLAHALRVTLDHNTALVAFVRAIAETPMCSDPGREAQCELASGPYCGAHDYQLGDSEIVAARALLAKCEGRP